MNNLTLISLIFSLTMPSVTLVAAASASNSETLIAQLSGYSVERKGDRNSSNSTNRSNVNRSSGNSNRNANEPVRYQNNLNNLLNPPTPVPTPHLLIRAITAIAKGN